jgi:hypothetical protein
MDRLAVSVVSGNPKILSAQALRIRTKGAKYVLVISVKRGKKRAVPIALIARSPQGGTALKVLQVTLG